MNASWTKFNNTWMVRVDGGVEVEGDALTLTVVKKDGTSKDVMTFNEPEFTKDGVSIYCPISAMKFSRVAERNARANAIADGAVVRNGVLYHV